MQINNVPLHCIMCSVRRDFGEESVRHYLVVRTIPYLCDE